jgi:nucleolar GTP-binding protein
MNGGAGVYYYPHQDHFDLENDEWKWDVVPEIIDGKNVADYYDPEILARLVELEKEEDILRDAHEPFDYANYQDICEIHRKIHKRRLHIRRESSARKGKFDPKIRTVSDVEKGFDALGLDSSGVLKRQKRGRSIVRRERDSDDEIDVADIKAIEDPTDEQIWKKFKSRSKTMLRSRSKGADNPKRAFSIASRGTVGEADRKVYDLFPKHLNVGKRGIGKTDRR